MSGNVRQTVDFMTLLNNAQQNQDSLSQKRLLLQKTIENQRLSSGNLKKQKETHSSLSKRNTRVKQGNSSVSGEAVAKVLRDKAATERAKREQYIAQSAERLRKIREAKHKPEVKKTSKSKTASTHGQSANQKDTAGRIYKSGQTAHNRIESSPEKPRIKATFNLPRRFLHRRGTLSTTRKVESKKNPVHSPVSDARQPMSYQSLLLEAQRSQTEAENLMKTTGTSSSGSLNLELSVPEPSKPEPRAIRNPLTQEEIDHEKRLSDPDFKFFLKNGYYPSQYHERLEKLSKSISNPSTCRGPKSQVTPQSKSQIAVPSKSRRPTGTESVSRRAVTQKSVYSTTLPARKPAKVSMPIRVSDAEEYSDSDQGSLDGFIDDDPIHEEEIDYSAVIREKFGYDKRKYFNERQSDDRSMVTSFSDLLKEEKRSAKIGKAEDLADIKEEKLRRERKLKAKQCRR